MEHITLLGGPSSYPMGDERPDEHLCTDIVGVPASTFFLNIEEPMLISEIKIEGLNFKEEGFSEYWESYYASFVYTDFNNQIFNINFSFLSESGIIKPEDTLNISRSE